MNIGVILAGGVGMRMGNVDIPKQFIEIYGKPLIVHTMESFDTHPEIDGIVIVALKEWHEDIRIWLRKYEINKVKAIVDGGSTRQESIYNSLEYLNEYMEADDIVVIHDAARPLISHRIITDNIKYTKEYGAVDTVIPTADTIVRSLDAKTIKDVPTRKELYLGQTPQSFKYSIISNAHKKVIDSEVKDATDDCQLVLKMNRDVYLVEGEKLNFKITTPEDLLLLKSIIKLSKLERV